MNQHMSQFRHGDGVEAEPREGRATGSYVLVPEEMVASVYDAAERADMDPEGFVREAVVSALGVENPEVDVIGMNHEGAAGHIELSAPDLQTARQIARRQGADVDEYVQGVVRGAVEQTRQADEAQKQAKQAAQAAASGAFMPLPDPAGVLEAATNGAVRDPIRAAFQQGRGR